MKPTHLMMTGSVLLAAATTVLSAQNAGPDWPQWRGPRRDGTLTSFTAPKVWPDTLTQRWTIPVGEGYATPIVVGNRVYQFSRQGENEVMRAIDAATGKVIWEEELRGAVRDDVRHATARTRSEIDSDLRRRTAVYTRDEQHHHCLGCRNRQGALAKAQRTLQPQFHTAMSPLVDGGQMILHIGGDKQGALTAFDPATGAVKWEWKGDGPAYGSPIIAEIGGARHLMLFSQQNFIGVNPANGELLWSTPFEARSTTNSITPLVSGNTVVVSGQGKPLVAYTIANKGGKWAADLAWENPELSMSFSNGVLVGDALFSMSPLNSGQFFWADVKTGKTLWTSPPRQAGNAAITRSGDLLFVLKDDGQLMVGRANPAGFEPMKTYTVAKSATWAPPVISGNRIFVKDAETLALWTLD